MFFCHISFIISTHTPLAGRDIDNLVTFHTLITFQLTRPSRGVTKMDVGYNLTDDISTHTPLAGRDIDEEAFVRQMKISTHTPLAGRDDSLSP